MPPQEPQLPPVPSPLTPPSLPPQELPQPPVPTPLTPPPTYQPAGTQPPVITAPAPTAYAPAAPAKKHIPTWLKVVGVIAGLFVVILVFAAVTAISATKAPQKVSDQFVNDVQSDNASGAFALTSDSFQKATDQQQLDNLIKQAGPALQGEEKVVGRAIHKTTGIPETAVLVYTVKTTNGTKYIKTELQKSGDVWQIVNFKSSSKSLDTTLE
ncbi:MAG: hypothetical protein ABI602_01025 [Candidatus Saccharibacteria bacterium]